MAERKPKPQQPKTPIIVDGAPDHADLPDSQAPDEQAIPEAVRETAEILADSKMMAALNSSAEDLRAGRVVPLEQVERMLDL